MTCSIQWFYLGRAGWQSWMWKSSMKKDITRQEPTKHCQLYQLGIGSCLNVRLYASWKRHVRNVADVKQRPVSKLWLLCQYQDWRRACGIHKDGCWFRGAIHCRAGSRETSRKEVPMFVHLPWHASCTPGNCLWSRHRLLLEFFL